ncbi:MAG TPA: BsuBI/PstI family type II restriction endonuclease [Solirubrobacteraceae bacterium]|jgi:type II restriction enzyme|nr:BsuBI/PstI family type II restriction endonuclease [Solirubrobacteraceae bacterium]
MVDDGRFPRLDAEQILSASSGRSSKEFRAKSPGLQRLVNEALDVLAALGIPLDETARRLERIALAFLAVADVKSSSDWANAKSLAGGWSLTTREIIEYWNNHFGEHVSSGSYDDIRRKDLQLSVHAGVVIPDQPDTARNNPRRAYALADEYAAAVRAYGAADFENAVESALAGKETLADAWAAERLMARVPIEVAPGVELSFGPGDHNVLIKSTIMEFLPTFGHGAEVLYVGDAEKRDLHIDRDRLRELGVFELDHGELPDVVAYSEAQNWLFVIEAVHSSGPISSVRRDRLKTLLHRCTAGVVFVTAFADRLSFRKWIRDIAWQTEVWVASEPAHLIHFDGERFLGPYAS